MKENAGPHAAVPYCCSAHWPSVSILARIACAIGLHEWYTVLTWQVDRYGRLREMPTGERVCATCPARQMRAHGS